MIGEHKYLNLQMYHADGTTIQMQAHFYIAGFDLSTREDYRRMRDGKELWWSDRVYPIHSDDLK